MNRLFNYDNPVFQVLGRLLDLTILGLLFMVSCIPVVTVGAAASAIFRAVYDLTLEQGSGAVKNYFRAFRDNFKQATGAWLLGLLGFFSLFCDWFLLKLYFEGKAFTVLSWIVLILTLGLVGLLCYVFALIARYENTLWEHVRNGLILSIRYIHKTLLMVLIQMLPLLMATYMPYVLINTLLFWILFCAGLTYQANAYLLRPVFEKLESGELTGEGVEGEEDEDEGGEEE